MKDRTKFPRVLVVTQDRRPAMPCSPARARQLLASGQARILRRLPFVIALTNRVDVETQALRLKMDPGASETGLVLTAAKNDGEHVIWGANLRHRSNQIRRGLYKRRLCRNNRRRRKTRFRPQRCLRQRKGKLSPSLRSALDRTWTWVQRLRRWSPVTGVSVEVVRIDLQRMQDPDVQGCDYQRGPLVGVRLRDHLLHKHDRQCAYCSEKRRGRLEIDHISPVARGGTDRLNNLVIACEPCNRSKGAKSTTEIGHPHIQAGKSLRHATATNIMCVHLLRRLECLDLEVEVGNGAETHTNRGLQGYRKDHWIDAACVGRSGRKVWLELRMPVWHITSFRRHLRRVHLSDAYGFPRQNGRVSQVHGFRTGDVVVAVVRRGKHRGIHLGRIALRASGWFQIGSAAVPWKCCRVVQRNDGYGYALQNLPYHPKVDARNQSTRPSHQRKLMGLRGAERPQTHSEMALPVSDPAISGS